MRRTTPALGALVAASLATAGCSPAASDDVVAIGTTTMLGDVVGDIVACAGGTSETLIPVGVDPHDFSASSGQVADLVAARLVVANGLGLEEGLEDALRSAVSDGATVLEVAPLVDPIEFGGGSHADDEHAEEHEDGQDEDEHDHGSMDPHFWHDAARMARAAELVGTELADATGDDAYAACGTEVHDALMEADLQVRGILAAVPEDRRVLVTDHDAFGYFADAYDFEVAGVVIPGGSTLAEPSSQELSDLVETIEAEGVTAIFSDYANPGGLSEAVAGEVGTEFEVVELYVGSLGPEGSGADTYVGMITTNARRVADALG